MLDPLENRGGISITDAGSVGLDKLAWFYGSVITQDHALQTEEEASKLRFEIFDAYANGIDVDEFLIYRVADSKLDPRLIKLSRGKDADGGEEIIQSLKNRFGVDCTAIYLAAEWLAKAGNYSRKFDYFELFFTSENESLSFHYDGGKKEDEDEQGRVLVRTLLSLSGVRSISIVNDGGIVVSSLIPVGEAYELAVSQVEHSATYQGDCVALYMQGLQRLNK